MAEQVELFEININVDAAVKDSKRLAEEVAVLKAQTKKAKDDQGELSEEFIRYNNTLKATQKELRVNNKLTQDSINADFAKTGSIDQMRKQLSVVSVQWARLNAEERESSAEGKALTKQKLQLTEALRAEEKATGDTRRNVGNYADDILAAVSALEKQKEAQVKQIKELTDASNATEQGSIDQKKYALAIVQTKKDLAKTSKELEGYGEVVEDVDHQVVSSNESITSASDALGGFFPVVGQGSQGIKSMGAAFKVALGPIGLFIAAIGVIVGSIKTFLNSSEDGQDTANKFGAVFQAVVGNITDAISAFGKALLSPRETLQSIADWFENTFGNLLTGIIDGTVANVQKQFALIGLAWEKVKDVFTDNAEGIAESQAKVEEANQKLIEANKKLEQGMSDVSAAYDEVKNAVVALVDEQQKEIEISKQLADAQARLDRRIRDNITDEAEARFKISKLRDEAAQKDKTTAEERLRLLDEAQAIERQILEDNVRIAEEKARIKSEQNKLSNSTKEDLEELARLEADVFKVQEDSYKQLRRLESERQTAINEQKNIGIAAKKKEAEELAVVQALNDENEILLYQQKLTNKADLDRAALEQKRQEEITFAESIGADTTLIEKRFAKAKEDINKQEAQSKKSLALGFVDDLAGVAGEGTAISKAAGAAATTISTIQGAQAAFTGMATAIPGPIGLALGTAAAAAAAVSGFANVKKILTVKSGLPNESSVSGGGAVTASVPSISAGAPISSSRATAIEDVNAGIITRDTSVSDAGGALSQPVLVTDDVTVAQNSEFLNAQTATI